MTTTTLQDDRIAELLEFADRFRADGNEAAAILYESMAYQLANLGAACPIGE